MVVWVWLWLCWGWVEFLVLVVAVAVVILKPAARSATTAAIKTLRHREGLREE